MAYTSPTILTDLEHLPVKMLDVCVHSTDQIKVHGILNLTLANITTGR